MDTNIEEKIEQFFNKVEELLKSYGFQYINDEDYKYCNDRVWYIEESFEKQGKYVDIALKILVDEDCNPIEVKDIEIDDDNIVDDELYEKINSLYRSFFVD